MLSPRDKWFEGCIYDSNSYFLQSAISCLGIEATIYPIVNDDFTETKNVLNSLIEKYDLIKPVMHELGATSLFQVETMVGNRTSIVLSLPGNPRATLVTYHFLGKKYQKNVR